MTQDRIVVANLYGMYNKRPAAVKAWLRRMGIDTGLFSETGKLGDDLREVGHLYTGKWEDGRGAVDTSVLLGRKANHHSTKQITDHIKWAPKKPNLAIDRWITQVRVGDVVDISVHANAVIADRRKKGWLDNPGAVEWRQKGVPALRRRIARVQRRGLAVRIGGDMNFPLFRGKDVPDSPQDIFESAGLRFLNVDVMWFAWNPEFERLTYHNIGRVAPGADGHRTIRANLQER